MLRFTDAFRSVNEMIQDMKLRKFPVEGILGESILGHLRVGNLEFKIMV